MSPSNQRASSAGPLADVITIVVTYNRKDLLIKCLEAISSQTLTPSRVLIIDNASTDGTSDALSAGGWLTRPNISLLRLPDNIGGAGGFSYGMNEALKFGAQWLWLMDDDGVPVADCLERLLGTARQRRLDAVSPIQVDISDPSRPAFPIKSNSGRDINTIPPGLGRHSLFLEQQANLFNGMLISASAVLKIGLPRAELFIRGDEVEYTLRMNKHGLRFGTIADCYFYHPSDAAERLRIFFGLVNARDTGNDFKNYYMYRNKGLAFRENGWLWILPLDAVRYVYYFLVHKRLDLHGLKLWAGAMRDGLAKRLGRHPNF